jgi:hypothetical protein
MKHTFILQNWGVSVLTQDYLEVLAYDKDATQDYLEVLAYGRDASIGKHALASKD